MKLNRYDKQNLIILIYLLLGFLFMSFNINAQRQVKTLNTGWEFKLDNSSDSTIINLPHTWNAEDAFKNGNYYRGKGFYTKNLFIPEKWENRSVFLKFQGANQHTRVFVNNALVGEHIGGYTAFIFNLSNYLQSGSTNELKIEVDNSHNTNIPPLEADFNFYGGIYRDIELITTGKSHFQLEGEKGGNLLITTPEVNTEFAKVIFQGNITSKNQDLKLNIEITDPSGAKVSDYLNTIKSNEFTVNFQIDDPRLWSPEKPNLYNLSAKLIDPGSGNIFDTFSSSFGCRWFHTDPQKGFILNGEPIKLIGANRHQDFEMIGNALPNAIHRKDYQMIKEMGANFIRTAHYPQDPEVYRICDELGLLVWTEVPVINDVTNTEEYHQNAINMQREQILQLYNHPSVVFWGYMNEIFIRLVFTGDMSQKARNSKITTSIELAKKLEAETKKLDTTRLSVMALHEHELYNTSGIADIPDVIGWNLYFGWYTQGLENLGKFLDSQHKKYPDRPLIISEYGPGSDSRIQTNDPKPWDFSEAYQLKSHLSYLNQVMERNYMLGMAAWNFADFGSSGRQDSRPFINQKGLVNFNREPKDIYYYYKARLQKEDFVYIAGKNYENRIIKKDQPVVIKVFANSEKVELTVNDTLRKSSEVIDNIAKFQLNLSENIHQLKATSENSEHSRIIEVQFRENLVENIRHQPLTINVGSHSDFTDAETGEIWISDQEYDDKTFGFVGGEVFQHSKTKFQGTDANIKNTISEPLFQTMREGIDSYRFEVPKGTYRISLLMTEPNRSASVSNIYNLGSDENKSTEEHRVFDILINDTLVEEDMNPASEFGILTAIELSYEVKTKEDIIIKFRSKSGKPIISGIRLEKL